MYSLRIAVINAGFLVSSRFHCNVGQRNFDSAIVPWFFDELVN